MPRAPPPTPTTIQICPSPCSNRDDVFPSRHVQTLFTLLTGHNAPFRDAPTGPIGLYEGVLITRLNSKGPSEGIGWVRVGDWGGIDTVYLIRGVRGGFTRDEWGRTAWENCHPELPRGGRGGGGRGRRWGRGWGRGWDRGGGGVLYAAEEQEDERGGEGGRC